MKFMVEASARHVHVTRGYLEISFGEGYELTEKKDLSQLGQYVCEERVTVVRNKKGILGVSTLGPVRRDTQVESPPTDTRSIGASVPVRESGNIADSGSCKLVGPCGEIELTGGAIIAKRHTHATPEDAAELSVADKDIIPVKIDTPGRNLVFGDVVARVSPSCALAMHIDTDESNMAGCDREVSDEIVRQGIEEESKIKER